MSLKHKSLGLTVLATTLAFGIIMFQIEGPLRLVAGSLLALVLPGYGLTQAVFSKARLRSNPSLIEVVASSLGLSFITTILGAFILNITPWGLTEKSWAGLLALITLLGCGLALLQSSKDPVITVPYRNWAGWKLNLMQVSLLALAGLFTIAAIWLGWSATLPEKYPGFTQLWALPVDASQPSNEIFKVGISNQENQVVVYRLQIEQASLGAGSEVLFDWPRLELASGEKWETTINLPAPTQNRSRVEAKLYQLSVPNELYRRVVLQETQPITNK